MDRRQFIASLPAITATLALPSIAEAAPASAGIFPNTVLGRAFQHVRDFVRDNPGTSVSCRHKSALLAWHCYSVETLKHLTVGVEVANIQEMVAFKDGFVSHFKGVEWLADLRGRDYRWVTLLGTPSPERDHVLVELAKCAQQEGEIHLYTADLPSTFNDFRALPDRAYDELIHQLSERIRLRALT